MEGPASRPSPGLFLAEAGQDPRRYVHRETSALMAFSGSPHPGALTLVLLLPPCHHTGDEEALTSWAPLPPLEWARLLQRTAVNTEGGARKRGLPN